MGLGDRMGEPDSDRKWIEQIARNEKMRSEEPMLCALCELTRTIRRPAGEKQRERDGRCVVRVWIDAHAAKCPSIYLISA